MDGRDRDAYARYDDRVPRLRSSATSQGKRGPTSGFGRFDDDLELSDDPPSWQERFGPARQDGAGAERRPERSSRRDAASTPSTPSTRSRSDRYIADDLVDERSADAVADPFDRLRRVSERRGLRPTQDDLAERMAGSPAPTRERASRRATELPPVPRRARPTLPQPPFRAVGSALARSSQDAGALAKLSAAALASLLALTLFTAARIGSASDWLVLRLDAGGDPARWGTNESLWRVPLLLAFATVAGLILAWRLRRHDAFAAQFTIVAVLLLQGFGWVAAGRLLF